MSRNAQQHPTAHKGQLKQATASLNNVRTLLDSIASKTATKPKDRLIHKRILEAIGLLDEVKSICSKLTVENDVLRISEPVQAPALATLSERERQIFELIVAGLSNEEIAGQTHIASSTVRTYKLRVMKKLNVSNVPDLVRLAMHRSLNNPDHS